MPTLTQLKNVQKITYGGSSYFVESVTERVQVLRDRDENQTYARHSFAMSGFIEDSSVSNLKDEIDNLIENIQTPNQDLKFYRSDVAFREILASDTVFGPFGNMQLTDRAAMGNLQSYQLTFEVDLPISVDNGLVSHTYRESVLTEDGNTTRIERGGTVHTMLGTSAEAWVNSNLPAIQSGFTRSLSVDKAIGDNVADYRMTDTLETIPHNAVPGVLRSHTYTDSTLTDDGTVIRESRRGEVVTIDPTVASDWINANLPALTAGFVRSTTIEQDDEPTKATYTVEDVNPQYENAVPGVVKTHVYTVGESTENTVLMRKVQSGHVEMVSGNNAADWINANLPAVEEGFIRNIDITADDAGEIADYSATDNRITGNWNWPPLIDNGNVRTNVVKDKQRGVVTTVQGFYVGGNAQQQVDSLRASLTNIVRESVETEDVGGDGRISFRFEAIQGIGGSGDPNKAFLYWTESIEIEGGGRPRQVRLVPDASPFIFNGPKLPYRITVTGSAQAIGEYVKSPSLIAGLEDFLHITPEVRYHRVDDATSVTTWRQIYVTNNNPGDLVPGLPRLDFV